NSWPNVFHDFKIPSEFESIGKLDKIIEWGTDRYDNVFIDEAHKFRNEANISYEKLAQICRGKKVVLVTATPLNNSPIDILAQIKLFQKGKNSTIPGVRNLDHFFNSLQKRLIKLDRKENYDEYMAIVQDNSKQIRDKVLKHLMVRRTRNEIARYFEEDLKVQGLKFPEVAPPEPIFYELNEDLDLIFRETVKRVTDKNTFTYARYTPLLYLKEELSAFDETSQRNMGSFMRTLLVKRLESSFFAFKNTLDRFILSYENFIKALDRGSVFFSQKYWYRVVDYFMNDDFESIQRLIDEEKADIYPADAFKPELRQALINDLQTLKSIQTDWASVDYDPKLDKFIFCLKNDKCLSINKLIIFTESRETAEYLHQNLELNLNEKAIVYHGDSNKSELNKVIQNFDARAARQKNDYRILISTEVLSEGINLHRANVVINYDIPWNPTRMVQRVGRVNRVDTDFDEIFTYNFFPTEQSNDVIKLKEAAIAKIHYFIEMLGNDARLLTDGEEIKSFELFNKLTSKEFITGEDDDTESELKYLSVIKDIRDNQQELFQKIKELPKKARTVRKMDILQKLSHDALLTYFRKGRLEKFYLATQNDAEELDFLTAAGLFECKASEKRDKLLINYYDLLEKNKRALVDNLTEEDVEATIPSRGRDNAVRILKIVKSREVRKYYGFTDIEETYLKDVARLLEEGALPKSVTKRIFNEVRDLTDPRKILGAIRHNLPDEFFKSTVTAKDQSLNKPNEVILCECFLK
ncbi:MAG TPA: helicase, partial [Candidatus Marinimicrobia bacterium]|nr:helicase [Candidatus Neomarinimicrobiota bacterium]